MADTFVTWPKIGRAATDKAFFELMDLLSVNPGEGKVMLRITQHIPKPSVNVRHSMNVGDFLYLAEKIINGQFDVKDLGEGGSVPEDGAPLSTRDIMLRLEKIPGAMGADKKMTQTAFDAMAKAGAPKGKWSEYSQETLRAIIAGLDAMIGVKPAEGAPIEARVATLQAPGTITEFRENKGNESTRYSTGYEARVLSISKQPARNGKGFTYFITIENGPGEPAGTGKGAVKMARGASEPAKKVFFNISEHELISMMVFARQYIAAFMASNFMEIREAHRRWNTRQDADHAEVAEVASEAAQEAPQDSLAGY